jgi:phage-related protein
MTSCGAGFLEPVRNIVDGTIGKLPLVGGIVSGVTNVVTGVIDTGVNVVKNVVSGVANFFGGLFRR